MQTDVQPVDNRFAAVEKHYGTFTYQEVATYTASNSGLDVPTTTWLKVLTFIHGELCLRIPQTYSQRFSSFIRLTAPSLEEGEASVEEAHGLQGLNHGEEKPSSSFWTQVDSRWYPFVERCRQEWLAIHAFGLLIAGVLIILFTIGDPPFTPATRTTALLSLESAIFSILFSRVHYFRFSSMPERQIAFCLATRKPLDSCDSKSPFWNLWVILALPAIYAVWSIILLIITLMAFAFTPECIRYIVSDDTPLPLWLPVIVCTAVIPSIAIFCKVRRSFLVLEGISTVY